MIYSEKLKIQLKDVEKGGYVKNRGILEMFENVATHHSDSVNFGVNDVHVTGLSWILMDWKVKVINRPRYGQVLKIDTWARTINGTLKKTYTYRDFEMYDEKGNLCVIGTSKWVLINNATGRIAPITEEVFSRYQAEDKSVLEEQELDKIKVPENYTSEIVYQVTRRDIDFVGHMHNLYYLDLAYNTLPDDVFEVRPFSEFRISYKRELKLGEVVKCKYVFCDEQHIVNICSEDESKVHCVIAIK